MTRQRAEIRMGIVGLGFMGRRYAQFVSRIEGMTLAGVVDLDRAIAERTAAEFGGRVYEGAEDLAASADIHAVMVCTPEHLHVEPAVAALRTGKPAMVEKPIAHSLDAARAISDAASTAGVPLLVGHILRFEPRWIAARQRLDADAIGKVVSIPTRRI